MTQLLVDGLTFTFPAEWKAHQYDRWSFYRNQFGAMRDGIKAIDILALDGASTVWLVEVKDYRVHQRTKPSDLAVEISSKVLDTLAALLPAQANANDEVEKQMASAVLRATKLRVVLHLEQPQKDSKLFPRAIDPVAVTQQLRRLLKPVDAHPSVVERSDMRALQWTVT